MVTLLFFTFGISVLLYLIIKVIVIIKLQKEGYLVSYFDLFFANYKIIKKISVTNEKHKILLKLYMVSILLPIVISIFLLIYVLILR